jgi:phthalate 4,5-dioxygenase reductase subunit
MSEDTGPMMLQVTRTEPEAQGIQRIELRHPDGRPLPPFTAGAHVRVRTPAGAYRHYSLANAPYETERYELAVKREEAGRGGSRSMVDALKVGDRIEVHAPENQFALDERARSFVLIAGGIGITPIRSMALQLAAEGTRDFRVYYLTRAPEVTAFLDELRGGELVPHVHIHHDGGDPARAFDLWPVLEKPGSLHGRHVYCCGPSALMDAVRDMTGHWPTSAVHFERFGADTQPHADDVAFEVALARSGRRLHVPVGRSMLDVLRDEGVHVPSSCESGTCGSCKTRLLGGEADHRDMVLLEEEKSQYVMVCVSRARTPELVLDL